MKKLVSLVMVVIMLSALCATAMAANDVTCSAVGKWLSSKDGYMEISSGGYVRWLNGNYYTGQIYESKGTEYPAILVLKYDTPKYGTVSEIYAVEVKAKVLTLTMIGYTSCYDTIVKGIKDTCTFEKQ